MPNHVTIEMNVTGSAEDLEAFVEKHIDDDTLNLASFISMPEELEGTTAPANPPRNASDIELAAAWNKEQKRLKKLYGANNWYDWCINNWGTKWNTYDGSTQTVGEKEISLSFLTAWSLPEPVFEKMFEMYPNLDFHIKCVEEGGNFCGTIEFINGMLFYNIMEGYDDTWKEYAADMMLGWYDEDAETESRIKEALVALRAGRVEDQSVVNEIVLFIAEHREEFNKFVTK